jgi:hypothetical protein
MRSNPNRPARDRLACLATAVSAVAVAAAATPAAGHGASSRGSNQFLGNCQIEVTSTRDASTGRFRAAGVGTCDGQLNGRTVTRAAFHTEFSGTSTRVGPALVEQHGSGVIAITDPRRREATSFEMSEQTLGTVGSMTCRGGGEALVAVVPVAPPSTVTTYVGTVQFVSPCTST